MSKYLKTFILIAVTITILITSINLIDRALDIEYENQANIGYQNFKQADRHRQIILINGIK